MKISYPAYYEKFACIADKCPDSCCAGWCVDVDENAANFYRALPGALGDRLRQVLKDTEDGVIMEIENGRCPMWRDDNLCRIHAELGHEALCKVCREFPRLRHDYGDFVEMGLELSCPEAARLILSDTDWNAVCSTVPGGEDPEYDTEIMEILKRTRAEFLVFLKTTTLTFPQILSVFLLYAHEVQEELDGGAPAALSPEDCLADATRFAQNADPKMLAEFFLGLEILTDEWKARLTAPLADPQWTAEYRALLRYFIDRYYLQAVSDYDILCRAKFAITACLLIGYLGGELTRTAQLFSKEIENDLDNLEAIFDGAYTAPALTDVHLLSLLK